MKYALTLTNDNRILSATFSEYNSNGILVDYLPKGNIPDYKYINNQYIYEPLPKEEDKFIPQPTLEERVSDIELALADIYGGNIQ